MSLKRIFVCRRNFASLTSRAVMDKIPDYAACIDILNNLQSNAQYIKLKGTTDSSNLNRNNNLVQVQKFLERTGVSLDDLDKLSVIHVTGTKGKGTTCAFTETILRNHGYKTGFFSSPHLIEVRERIRINGKPIEKEEFAKFFWKIYSLLDKAKSYESDMPPYFRFLTIMAFHVFLEKKVDVAIVEVGIGGELDCTNVLRTVPVVGITPIGIDHTSLLGKTIESIAWNKGGIMKEGCMAFTVPQTPIALTVLEERSAEKKCQLQVVHVQHFPFSSEKLLPSDIFDLNASLAVTLSQAWINSTKNIINNCRVLNTEIVEKSLLSCLWPGRFQIKNEKNITYYLDGAHTSESITICSKWFKQVTTNSTNKKVLMFNITGGRDAESLLKQLKTCEFDIVLFVTNNATGEPNDVDSQIQRCEQHKQFWLKLEQNDTTKAVVKVFPNVLEGIKFLNNCQIGTKYDLLVTGSIHLIGALFTILEPDLNSNGL